MAPMALHGYQLAGSCGGKPTQPRLPHSKGLLSANFNTIEFSQYTVSRQRIHASSMALS